jgi:hypothetical protein
VTPHTRWSLPCVSATVEWMLLSSTPNFAAALRFPLSSAHRITSRLNFAVYDSLLDFWRPSSITRVKKKKAVCLPVFLQLKLLYNPKWSWAISGSQALTGFVLAEKQRARYLYQQR